MAADVMAKLPELIDEDETRRLLKEVLHQPLNIVLLQEVVFGELPISYAA